MSNSGALLADATARALQDALSPARRQSASAGGWQTELWPLFDELGLPKLMVGEEHGGSGVSPIDACAVIEVLGRFALPCPLAETLLAHKLMADHKLPSPEKPLTLAPQDPDQQQGLRLRQSAGGWIVDGSVQRAPWGLQCNALLAHAWDGDRTMLCLIDSAAATHSTPGQNLAGEPRDQLVFENHALPAATVTVLQDPELIWRSGSVLRSVQIAGALGAMLALTVDYAGERIQFGRPIAKFQAIQQQLALFAGEATAATAAARYAFSLFDSPRADLQCAAAKIYAGRAASRCAAIAHQVHGAIGFTQEYDLQFLSRRLWSWREEFGNESWWAERLGKQVAGAGGDQLWPMLSADRPMTPTR